MKLSLITKHSMTISTAKVKHSFNLDTTFNTLLSHKKTSSSLGNTSSMSLSGASTLCNSGIGISSGYCAGITKFNLIKEMINSRLSMSNTDHDDSEYKSS